MREARIEGGPGWKWVAEPEPASDYLALATYIQLRSALGLPRFLWYSRRIHQQLPRSAGVLGFSFRGEFPKRYWTISAWETPRHLVEFIRTMPHGRVMKVLQGAFERFDSVRWQVDDSDLPLAWPEALRRLEENGTSK